MDTNLDLLLIIETKNLRISQNLLTGKFYLQKYALGIWWPAGSPFEVEFASEVGKTLIRQFAGSLPIKFQHERQNQTTPHPFETFRCEACWRIFQLPAGHLKALHDHKETCIRATFTKAVFEPHEIVQEVEPSETIHADLHEMLANDSIGG